MHNIINYANFGDDQFKGLRMTRSNFALSHRLSSSSSRHHQAIMSVCDQHHMQQSARGTVQTTMQICHLKTSSLRRKI